MEGEVAGLVALTAGMAEREAETEVLGAEEAKEVGMAVEEDLDSGKGRGMHHSSNQLHT